MNIVFFGSFQHYSTYILNSLLTTHDALKVVGVVTTPPAPAGRKQILTKTHVHQFAEDNNIEVFPFEELNNSNLETLIENCKLKIVNSKNKSIDAFLVAGYGKLLPPPWLNYPSLGSINLHFSLLPKYRGANPAEWATILGETETGISLIEMAQEFDNGDVYFQEKIPLLPTDTRVSIYENLYKLGASKLPMWLSKIYDLKSNIPVVTQPKSPTPEARRFIRAHGFIDWQNVKEAMNGQPLTTPLLNTHLKTAFNYLFSDSPTLRLSDSAKFIERTIRALYAYPGVWTYAPTTKGKKRIKIHSAHIKNDKLVLDEVQLEGLSPTFFNQIKNQLSD